LRRWWVETDREKDQALNLHFRRCVPSWLCAETGYLPRVVADILGAPMSDIRQHEVGSKQKFLVPIDMYILPSDFEFTAC
jgi:hypothetical protein